MTVEKKDLDWGNLDFSYRKTDYSYVSNYKDGAWDEGALTTDHSITTTARRSSKASRRTPPRMAPSSASAPI